MFDIDKRFEYNMKCMDLLYRILMEKPYLRLGQLLYITGFDEDRFNEEPNVTLKRLEDFYKAHQEKK